MEIKKIRELMQAMGRYDIQKLRLKLGDDEVELEKPGVGGVGSGVDFVHSSGVSSSCGPFTPLSADAQDAISKAGAQNIHEKTVLDGKIIESPIVGTFYSSPKPGAQPFVKIGDRVSENQVIGIVEAMKVMNEVKAGVQGVIEEIFLEDGSVVEYGTKIMRVREN